MPVEHEVTERPIEYVGHGEVVSVPATHFVVQHLGQEMAIFFFEIKPPFIFNLSKENDELASSVKAQCVAKVVISNGRLPELIEILQSTLMNLKQEFPQTDTE